MIEQNEGRAQKKKKHKKMYYYISYMRREWMGLVKAIRILLQEKSGEN